MANDKKNINELVSADDDPTAELEALDLSETDPDAESEVSATTTGYAKAGVTSGLAANRKSSLASDVRARSETTEKLQFDLEVLHAKWLGLKTEIEAREEQAQRLNIELCAVKQALQESDQRIAKRDGRISDLEVAIQERDAAYRSLADELTTLQQEFATDTPTDSQKKNQMLKVLAGQLASGDVENRELQTRLTQMEEYADQLRYQLRLNSASTGEFENRLEVLDQQLSAAREQNVSLQTALDNVRIKNADLEKNIATLNDIHAEEIRNIRFELGDAQETLTEREIMAEQLASDLVQNRSVREELETKLAEVKKQNESRIHNLEIENKRLRLEAEAMNEHLQTKSEAINSLLAELGTSTQQAETVVDIDDTSGKIDDRISDHVDDTAYLDRERVARLLIGHFDDQELRFPLFKNRLTIGRTRRNDIQLKSEHVSRRHAVVVIEGDVTRVIDWGSKNGVFVNSRRVKEHFLKNGDVVGVGTAEFRFEERPMRDT